MNEIVKITGRSQQSVARVLEAAGLREKCHSKPVEAPTAKKDSSDENLLKEIAENTQKTVELLERLITMWG